LETFVQLLLSKRRTPSWEPNRKSLPHTYGCQITWHFFKDIAFQEIRWNTSMGVRRGGKTGLCIPWKLGLRTKNC